MYSPKHKIEQDAYRGQDDGFRQKKELSEPLRTFKTDTKPRPGHVREKILQIQKKGTWARNFTLKHFGKAGSKTTGKDEKEDGRQDGRQTVVESKESYKSSKMVMDKIWGNRKRSQVNRNTKSNGIRNGNLDSTASNLGKESIWERLSRTSSGHVHHSPSRSCKDSHSSSQDRRHENHYRYREENGRVITTNHLPKLIVRSTFGRKQSVASSRWTAEDQQSTVKASKRSNDRKFLHYQSSIPSTGAPSFRQYRRVFDARNVRGHRVSPNSSSRVSSSHHRRRTSRQDGTSHRQFSNGGIHHKEDKASSISRYWSIDKGGSSVNGGSYGRVRRNLREKGQLFQDPDFPATTRSLNGRNKGNHNQTVWLRPHEICARPKFIAEGATRFDVERGDSGDPWLLQAVSTLTLTPKFLDRVVPPDQAFDHTYCGVFRFRFWQFGEWVEVLVDDRLPTQKGRLVFLHSTDPAEFWAALLEKAYAKLYGSYEALHGGYTTRALQDLTGGIVQSFPLSLQDKFLSYQVLNSAVPRSSLLVASIDNSKDGGSAVKLRNGLVTQHAYSVTGLARVRSKVGEVPLVRLRNPWGAGEWNGPWSEESWEWDGLSDRDKELLSVRVRNEGEFWMGFDDFIRHFSQLDIVHVGPDDWMNEPALHSKKPWRAVLARRRWRAGYNAGGGPQYPETTSYNPQFHVQIPRAGLSKCHVVVSVTQQYQTSISPTATSSSPTSSINTTTLSTAPPSTTSPDKKRKLHPIGFAVYEVPGNLTRLTPTFVGEHSPLDVTNYSTARETVTFFTLPPGEYMVVPHTQHPNTELRFLLRILTDEQSNIWEVNEDNMVFRSASLGVGEEVSKPLKDKRLYLQRLLTKYPQEIDAVVLHKLLSKHWKMFLLEKPSLELAKSLVMLRDYNISGKLSAIDAPSLLLTLQFWRMALSKYDKGGASKTSSYALRGALWEAGVTVSNKVLECLVLRFAKDRVLTAEAFVMAIVRLHLAHERYHSIDTKMRGNPLSLEEMILMTIYS